MSTEKTATHCPAKKKAADAKLVCKGFCELAAREFAGCARRAASRPSP